MRASLCVSLLKCNMKSRRTRKGNGEQENVLILTGKNGRTCVRAVSVCVSSIIIGCLTGSLDLVALVRC